MDPEIFIRPITEIRESIKSLEIQQTALKQQLYHIVIESGETGADEKTVESILATAIELDEQSKKLWNALLEQRPTAYTSEARLDLRDSLKAFRIRSSFLKLGTEVCSAFNEVDVHFANKQVVEFAQGIQKCRSSLSSMRQLWDSRESIPRPSYINEMMNALAKKHRRIEDHKDEIFYSMWRGAWNIVYMRDYSHQAPACGKIKFASIYRDVGFSIPIEDLWEAMTILDEAQLFMRQGSFILAKRFLNPVFEDLQKLVEKKKSIVYHASTDRSEDDVVSWTCTFESHTLLEHSSHALTQYLSLVKDLLDFLINSFKNKTVARLLTNFMCTNLDRLVSQKRYSHPLPSIFVPVGACNTVIDQFRTACEHRGFLEVGSGLFPVVMEVSQWEVAAQNAWTVVWTGIFASVEIVVEFVSIDADEKLRQITLFNESSTTVWSEFDSSGVFTQLRSRRCIQEAIDGMLVILGKAVSTNSHKFIMEAANDMGHAACAYNTCIRAIIYHQMCEEPAMALPYLSELIYVVTSFALLKKLIFWVSDEESKTMNLGMGQLELTRQQCFRDIILFMKLKILKLLRRGSYMRTFSVTEMYEKFTYIQQIYASVSRTFPEVMVAEIIGYLLECLLVEVERSAVRECEELYVLRKRGPLPKEEVDAKVMMSCQCILHFMKKVYLWLKGLPIFERVLLKERIMVGLSLLPLLLRGDLRTIEKLATAVTTSCNKHYVNFMATVNPRMRPVLDPLSMTLYDYLSQPKFR